MKNKMISLFMAAITAGTLFVTGCENNDSLVPDESSKYDGELVIKEEDADGSVKTDIYLSDLADGQEGIKTLITLTSTTDEMDRVYITKNIGNTGEKPFELPNVDNKADGSLDLKSTKNYSFVLTLPNLKGVNAQTVVYKVWATNGKGDFRDSSKSRLAGVGSIVVHYGGMNPEPSAKSFSAKIFAAPAANGSSESFMSLLNGKLYKLSEGTEYAALWDFGYYYGESDEASLASVNNYPSDVFDIEQVSGTPLSELHKCYFKLSDKSSSQFNDITKSNDLEFIEKSNVQRVNKLKENDIVEFVDHYGKKGLIKVVEVVPGYSPSTNYIKIDVVVQP